MDSTTAYHWQRTSEAVASQILRGLPQCIGNPASVHREKDNVVTRLRLWLKTKYNIVPVNPTVTLA